MRLNKYASELNHLTKERIYLKEKNRVNLGGYVASVIPDSRR